MSWKTLEKSGLKPTAPTRLTRNWSEALRFIDSAKSPIYFVDGDLAESMKRSASDRLGELVP